MGGSLGDWGILRQAVICGESYDYPVHLELTTSYFPEKTYGDVTFPAGEYEALRIEIGEAKGITGGVSYIQISVLLMQFMQSSRKMERKNFRKC